MAWWVRSARAERSSLSQRYPPHEPMRPDDGSDPRRTGRHHPMTAADASGGPRPALGAERLVGRAISRVEDEPLLAGRGRFVDDIPVPGLLSVAFVRSPYAHARIAGVDADEARGMPGVTAVLTLDELRPVLTSDVVAGGMPTAAIRHVIYRPVLASREVVYAGETVAMVVAASRH